MIREASIPFPAAVLFDMDGTLTERMLDFDAIRAEMKIGSQAILEALAEMSASRRAVAEEILARHEDLAVEQSTLNLGCHELLDWLEARQTPVAVITRNSRRCAVSTIARHGLHFDVLITRDDGLFKPDPAPLLEACRRIKVEPSQCWMIGDGEFDVLAGNAAGCKTVWLDHGLRKMFAAEPWRTVGGLPDVFNLLRGCVSVK